MPIIECSNCKKKFNVKPSRIKKSKNQKLTCSIKCVSELRKTWSIGEKNPNYKYMYNRNIFKKIETEEIAYFLGWIASDGSISYNNSINIGIHKKDIKILEILKKLLNDNIPITKKTNTIINISINSKEVIEDICNHLSINLGSKHKIIRLPNLEKKLIWHFLRGYFDGDGSIHKITEKHCSPYCSISSNSNLMLNDIKNFCEVECTINEKNHIISWSGNNCLDFLSKIYDSSKIKLNRKYEQYLEISTWVPTVSYSRYFKNEMFHWAKTDKNAIAPFKIRASDSGYDLTIIKEIKRVGDVIFYDTGIKVRPSYGVYFTCVPRSSISKTGYMMANSIGIIDRTYHGNIIIALRKINIDSPDLELPCRIAQLIPMPIVHMEPIEVDDFTEKTNRDSKGFGSTGKS